MDEARRRTEGTTGEMRVGLKQDEGAEEVEAGAGTCCWMCGLNSPVS